MECDACGCKYGEGKDALKRYGERCDDLSWVMHDRSVPWPETDTEGDALACHGRVWPDAEFEPRGERKRVPVEVQMRPLMSERPIR